MDVKIIKQNEQSNNCSTIHLYYNNEMHSWIAYGHSAYTLRLLVKSHHIDSIRGFSTTMQMPYTAINKGALKLSLPSLHPALFFSKVTVRIPIVKSSRCPFGCSGKSSFHSSRVFPSQICLNAVRSLCRQKNNPSQVWNRTESREK